VLDADQLDRILPLALADKMDKDLRIMMVDSNAFILLVLSCALLHLNMF
jgi:hypothetical protein